MNVQTRRCTVCNHAFKLATLRARETECYGCQRKRADRMTQSAVDSGQLQRVLFAKYGAAAVADYRPRQPQQGPRVQSGQLFETWDQACRAKPSDWTVIGMHTGGYRVYPPVLAPRHAVHVPDDCGQPGCEVQQPQPSSVDKRVTRAMRWLEDKREQQALEDKARTLGYSREVEAEKLAALKAEAGARLAAKKASAEAVSRIDGPGYKLESGWMQLDGNHLRRVRLIGPDGQTVYDWCEDKGAPIKSKAGAP